MSRRRPSDRTKEPAGSLTPVRVVHLIGRLSQGGGVQIVVRRLAAHVDPQRVDLHVVAMRPALDDISDVPMTFHPGRFMGSRLRIRDRLAITLRMGRQVRALRPDVVQVHSGMAWLGFAARLLSPRARFVLEVHDAPGSGRHGVWTERLEGWWLRLDDVTAICHSSQVAHALVERAQVPPQKIRTFPLGIDLEEYRPRSAAERRAWRQTRGYLDTDVVGLVVSRAAPFKRLDLAIDATLLAQTEGLNLKLLIIGGGTSAMLSSQVERMGASAVVRMEDYAPDLAMIIAACDVLYSTSEYEGFGLTLIEAMASGIPVVAMAVGGVTDVVDDGTTGFLVPSGDLRAFAERLQELAGDPRLRHALGSAGRARAEARFSGARTAEAFERVYLERLPLRHHIVDDDEHAGRPDAEINFTVVIPAHNDEDLVAEAVRSALGQAEICEVIVVDDGSEDATVAAVSGIDDSRIHLLSQTNRGPAQARNVGAAAAQGSHLVFLDADDVLMPGALATFTTAHRRGFALARSGGAVDGREGFAATDPHPYPRGAPLAGTFSISRELFERIGGYDAEYRYGENSELLLRAQDALRRIGRPVGIARVATVQIRSRSGRPSDHYSSAKLAATLRMLTTHEETLAADPPVRASHHAIASHLLRSAQEPRLAALHARLALEARPWSARAWLRWARLQLDLLGGQESRSRR